MTGGRTVLGSISEVITVYSVHRNHKAYTAIQISRRIIGFGLVSLAIAIALLAQVVLPDGEESDIPRYHYEWDASMEGEHK